MRRSLFLLAFLLLSLPAYAQSPADHAADEEAIKAAVFKETKSFYGRDLDGLLSVWLHDSRTSRTIVGGTGAQTQMGWENIEPGFKSTVEQYPDPITVHIDNQNHVITTDGNMAWVEYDQTLTAPDDPSRKRTSKEMRALVKQDGAWRIFKQVTYDTFTNEDEAAEAALNMMGYEFLEAGKVEEAIKVFKLNVELYPQSWNVYDSLGEAYMTAGNKELAIENYEKSMELNPENPYGKEALAKLRQK